MFEIRKNLDLRKILAATNIFLKSRFAALQICKIEADLEYEIIELTPPNVTSLSYQAHAWHG